MRRPAYLIRLGDLDLTQRFSPLLVSLGLTEKRGEEADQLDITLDATSGDIGIPRPGVKLAVAIGWAGGLVDKGDFTVDDVEHSGPPDTITIRARAADFTGALRNRREKSWRDTTLGAVVREVAGRHGLTPRISGRLAAIELPVAVQGRESDLAFLRRLGRENDAVATIKAGQLLVTPIGAGQTAGGQALPSAVIFRSDGDRHSFSLTKREDHEGVTASWHDRDAAEKKDVTVGKSEGAKRISRTFPDEASARRAASAELSRSRREPAKLTLDLAIGDAELYPEQRARVIGFPPEISDRAWLISEVSHRLGEKGFVSSLTLDTA